MENNASNEDLLDFSQPWELSDAVLVFEEEKFHVHRCILAIWSPVFSRMFAAEFKEKTAEEIPLPGKKASEIKELLLMIYPTSTRQINESNYGYLLDLAKEYMMIKLTEKCESYLLTKVTEKVEAVPVRPPKPRCECLDLLGIAQEYELEKLQPACVKAAQGLSLSELKNHKMYEKISLPNYRKIAEGKIGKMERELWNQKKTYTFPLASFASGTPIPNSSGFASDE